MQLRISLLRIETEHVVISWKDGVYKVAIGDQMTSREVIIIIIYMSLIMHTSYTAMSRVVFPRKLVFNGYSRGCRAWE